MPIGFKEWKMVCDALAAGTQSVILRKGGIAEGRDGFEFKHPEFYLFPTLFHEQAAKIRAEHAAGLEAPVAEEGDATREEISIDLFARIDFHRVILDWDKVAELEPFHVWTEQEVRKRFEWDQEPGISLACVRVFRLAEPWILANSKAFGGCRSWITLPERTETGELEPVLDDAAFAAIRTELSAVLGV